MEVKPGTIILISREDLPGIEHIKFTFCVSDCLCFYFFLNSEPFRFAPEAQVTVFGGMDLPRVLDHTSYINSSQLLEFPAQVAQKAFTKGKVWTAPQTIIDRVIESVKKSRYLTPLQKEFVLHHLTCGKP